VKNIPFDDMTTSNEMFGHLMDQSAEKTKWNRDTALTLLNEADWLEDLATKYRHLAAVLVLEGQEFSKHTADLLAMEFPMTDGDEPSEEEEEEPDE
jgi:hypothetical protein